MASPLQARDLHGLLGLLNGDEMSGNLVSDGFAVIPDLVALDALPLRVRQPGPLVPEILVGRLLPLHAGLAA